MPQGSLFASMIRTEIYSLASRRSGSAVGRQLHAFLQVPRSAGAFSDWFQPLKIKSFINNVTATPLEKIEEPLKGFSWEFDKIKSADNRVLQEQLQNKCTENKELEEKVLQLEQQLTSVSSDNKRSSSENCVHDEYTEELRKKVQLHDKPAFIFCVEDRALFCKDCDEPIHSANSRAANHQRFLATGIRVALGSSCSKENAKSDVEPKPPPKSSSQQIGPKTTPLLVPGITSPSWGVDDLLQLSDYSSPDKVEHTWTQIFAIQLYKCRCFHIENDTGISCFGQEVVQGYSLVVC